MKPPKKLILPLIWIRLDSGTQLAPLDFALIEQLQAAEDLSSVDCVWDGNDLWLWRGFETYHAACRSGRRVIVAEVYNCQLTTALAHLLRETHFNIYSNADSRKCVLKRKARRALDPKFAEHYRQQHRLRKQRAKQKLSLQKSSR